MRNLFLPIIVLVFCLTTWGPIVQAQTAGPGAGEEVSPEAGATDSGEEVGDSYDETGTAASAALEEYARIAASFAMEDEEDKEVKFHTCRYVRGETLVRVLENFLTPAGTVAVSEEADFVVISDVADNMDLLMQVAGELDRPVRQVLVETRIIEFGVDSDFQKEVNLEFQKLDNVADIPNLPTDYMDFVKRLTDAFVDPGSNPLNTRGSLSYMKWDPERETLLTAFVRFLETNGKAKILSAPNLILRRGVEGSIITGEEVPIQTQTITSGSVSTSTTFKKVGIKLRVTPVTIEGERIRLAVSPEVSNVTRTDEATGAPIIAIRNAQTELETTDGQLVSIGGLLRSEQLDRERRVPILSSIPLLGHLFRGVSRRTVESQLVIFLRATILDDDLESLPAIRNLELPADVQDAVDAAEDALATPAPRIGRDVNSLLDDGEEINE